MAVERIADLDDPRLEDYRHLREPSRRMAVERNRGIFTLEGALSVEALLASSYVMRSVLVAEEHADKMADRLGTGAALFAVPSTAMTELTGVHFHRGVLAVAERPEPRSVAEVVARARTIVVLEGVNDHENIGALFRQRGRLRRRRRHPRSHDGRSPLPASHPRVARARAARAVRPRGSMAR